MQSSGTGGTNSDVGLARLTLLLAVSDSPSPSVTLRTCKHFIDKFNNQSACIALSIIIPQAKWNLDTRLSGLIWG